MKACSVDHVRKNTQSGWLLPQIQTLDQHASARWGWWIDRLLEKELGEHQIPQISFLDNPAQSKCQYSAYTDVCQTGPEALKLFVSVCREVERADGARLGEVLRWFLWGLEPKGVVERPKLSDESEILLYQEGTQALCSMMMIPGDWGSQVTFELIGGSKSATAWFPTPMSLVRVMGMVTFDDALDNRAKSVYDPACGTGVTLLYASNYCLDLYGQDIDPLMISWTKLHGYLFVPWMVYGDKSMIAEIRANRERVSREHSAS